MVYLPCIHSDFPNLLPINAFQGDSLHDFCREQREADQSDTFLAVLLVWNEAGEYSLSFSHWGSSPLYSVCQRWGRMSSLWHTPASSLSTSGCSLSCLLGLNELISSDSWSHLIYIHCWQFLLFKERGLKVIAAEDWGKTATEHLHPVCFKWY